MSMMTTKPVSMVTCMSSAALVARPAGMPRLAASSTTSVMPAKLSEGATVFMKKVPKTSLMDSRKRKPSLTAWKQ